MTARRLLIAATATAALTTTACSTPASPPTTSPSASSPSAAPPTKGTPVRIHLTVDGTTLDATLDNNQTARDFAAQLPLTLTLRDFQQTEKISDLPTRLSTDGAPDGTDARAGDLAYYVPWGNLAIFYKDSGHAAGLIKIGHITTGIEALASRHDGSPLTIEAAP